MNYYNEHDPKAAAWLRALIAAGEIPPGVVDERSITEIKATELTEYVQCHFFAGIGGWSLALKLAGWPEDKPVWTGSCPCQPFSSAGRGLGEADERHLWPVFRNLIGECRPPVVFGEQVASKAGLQWLDGVCADMEAAGYAICAADLCAAGVGAPHIRQRLYWVAEAGGMVFANGSGRNTRKQAAASLGHGNTTIAASGNGRMADTAGERRNGSAGMSRTNGRAIAKTSLRLGNSEGAGSSPRRSGEILGVTGRPNLWSECSILECTDGKTRRIESGSFPLAHGIPGRVGLLRGYGNAIVPQVAAEFIQSFCEI